MHEELSNAVSGLVGGSLAAALARFFVGRLFEKIEEMPEKLSEIKSQIAIITAKLDAFDRMNETLHDHERKIITLEARSGKSHRRSEKSC